MIFLYRHPSYSLWLCLTLILFSLFLMFTCLSCSLPGPYHCVPISICEFLDLSTTGVFIFLNSSSSEILSGSVSGSSFYCGACYSFFFKLSTIILLYIMKTQSIFPHLFYLFDQSFCLALFRIIVLVFFTITVIKIGLTPLYYTFLIGIYSIILFIKFFPPVFPLEIRYLFLLTDHFTFQLTVFLFNHFNFNIVYLFVVLSPIPYFYTFYLVHEPSHISECFTFMLCFFFWNFYLVYLVRSSGELSFLS